MAAVIFPGVSSQYNDRNRQVGVPARLNLLPDEFELQEKFPSARVVRGVGLGTNLYGTYIDGTDAGPEISARCAACNRIGSSCRRRGKTR